MRMKIRVDRPVSIGLLAAAGAVLISTALSVAEPVRALTKWNLSTDDTRLTLGVD